MKYVEEKTISATHVKIISLEVYAVRHLQWIHKPFYNYSKELFVYEILENKSRKHQVGVNCDTHDYAVISFVVLYY